eukprot:SAG11_NODE_15219_length_585_cov_0.582305_1_plen_162_part_01
MLELQLQNHFESAREMSPLDLQMGDGKCGDLPVADAVSIQAHLGKSTCKKRCPKCEVPRGSTGSFCYICGQELIEEQNPTEQHEIDDAKVPTPCICMYSMYVMLLWSLELCAFIFILIDLAPVSALADAVHRPCHLWGRSSNSSYYRFTDAMAMAALAVPLI